MAACAVSVSRGSTGVAGSGSNPITSVLFLATRDCEAKLDGLC